MSFERARIAPSGRFAIVVPQQAAEQSTAADRANLGSGRGRIATIAGCRQGLIAQALMRTAAWQLKPLITRGVAFA